MTVDGMLLVFCAGAAALALWIDARFPQLVPADLRAALVRLAVVLVVGGLAGPAVDAVLDMGVSPVTTMLGVVLPVLALSFLTAIWIIRAVQALFPGLRR